MPPAARGRTVATEPFDSNTGVTTRPALYEAVDPKAQPRYRLGGFQSVWHKGADGSWCVLFDDGIDPQPATDAEVAAFHAGLSTRLSSS